jgi:tripartite-type tricarboxylate transporter receptor subunit TctC
MGISSCWEMWALTRKIRRSIRARFTTRQPISSQSDWWPTFPPVLLTRKHFPANSLQEFAAYAKPNQDKLQYGSSGAGSAAQLGCSLLNSVLGLKVTHVPYRGAAPAMQDLIAGRIDYQCALLPAPLTQIEAKQVKALAILIKSRSPVLPNLPTADEQGLKDFDASAWHGIFMTKGKRLAAIGKSVRE